MNITTLKFSQDSLLRLTSLQFSQLLSNHETVIDYAPAKNYSINEDFSKPFLSVDNSLSNYFFESDPGKDIDTFVHHSFLTHFFPKTGKVKLIAGLNEPLAKLLPTKKRDTSAIASIGKTRFMEELQEQHIFTDKLNEKAVSNLIDTGSFKGQISCCECGIAGCSSEYLWAEDNYGLVSFHILAAGLQLVKLYPFQIV